MKNKKISLQHMRAALRLSVRSVALLAAMDSYGRAQEAIALPEINVAAQGYQVAPINSASEKTLTQSELNAQPATRPGELLEATPGLIVTQHSGEGKANQYFLRGFNLDHGTDLAITLDGMPLNMRTHGHGQGYADTNFLIPELVQSMRVRKGPYFADEGDFASAGAIHLDYVDTLTKGIAQITGGSFGYGRALAAKSTPAGQGHFLMATDASVYDGPWNVPDRVRKFNGLMRYSQGASDNGFSILGLGYTNRWTSTDQVAQRAVERGLIGRLGSLDSSDGGEATRLSLSGRFSHSDDGHTTRIDGYLVRSTLQLFNNFTYFLDDPVNGDQFSQTDRRTLVGFNASHAIVSNVAGFDMENKAGVQVRYDDIGLGLLKTAERTTLSTVRQDQVQESSVGFYGENTTFWTNWMRTIVGVRGDYYAGRVLSDTAANSGNVGALIASPKFSLIFGPFSKTEFFANAGTGFHSHDMRGTTISVDPTDKIKPLDKVRLLVRSKGAEAGVRTKVIDGLESSVSLFLLDYDSELLFVGDAGTTEASRPSRRVGIEWTNNYKVNNWFSLDADLAVTRARFTNHDPAGDFIPGAPNMIGSIGITVGEAAGWYGAAKLRHFGPRPLIEDDSARSGATTLVNGRVGYRWTKGIRLQLDALNIFNAKSNQIAYYYESQLRNEVGPVADRHIHPVEPLAFRLTLTGEI